MYGHINLLIHEKRVNPAFFKIPPMLKKYGAIRTYSILFRNSTRRGPPVRDIP